MTTDTIRKIVVTGAGGQIAYSLLFRLAAGELYGPEQKLAIVLHDLPDQQDRLAGVAMELSDCAFPLLEAVVATSDLADAFEDADVAFLLGAKPRGPGMQRRDLLAENASIFHEQGRVLNEVGKATIKIVVVGNPANTNAMILACNAPRIPRENITAMMRLDHNRAVSMIAKATGANVSEVERVAVWGNHSSTMVTDVAHAVVRGRRLCDAVDLVSLGSWLFDAVAERGSVVIAARGTSSAASAAQAALEHMRDWIHGTAGRWVSMGVFTEGAYEIDRNIVVGLPVICEDGAYKIAKVEIDEATNERIAMSVAELIKERETAFEITRIRSH